MFAVAVRCSAHLEYSVRLVDSIAGALWPKSFHAALYQKVNALKSAVKSVPVAPFATRASEELFIPEESLRFRGDPSACTA